MTIARAVINDRLERIENLIPTDVLAAAAIAYELKLEGLTIDSWFEELAGTNIYPLIIAETREHMSHIWGMLGPESVDELHRIYRTGLERLLDPCVVNNTAFVEAVEQLGKDLEYRLNQTENIWAFKSGMGWTLSRSMPSVIDNLRKLRASRLLNKWIGWNPHVWIPEDVMTEHGF